MILKGFSVSMRGGCGVSTYLIFTFVHTLYHTYLHTSYVPTYIRLLGTYIPTYIRLISNEFFKILFRMLVSARASLLQDRMQDYSSCFATARPQTLPQDGDSRLRANI